LSPLGANTGEAVSALFSAVVGDDAEVSAGGDPESSTGGTGIGSMISSLMRFNSKTLGTSIKDFEV
jgi:hypothetical protein